MNLKKELMNNINKGIVDKQFELCVDEPLDGVLHFNMLRKEFCTELIDQVESADNWTDSRHDFYPTYDVLLKDFDNEFNLEYVKFMDTAIKPMLVDHFKLDGKMANNVWYYECFVAKYSHELQAKLDLHHDNADFASVLTLNDNYEGGGTYFARQKTLHKSKVGEMTLHPGKITHLHGGRPVTNGTRYILVTFMNVGEE